MTEQAAATAQAAAATFLTSFGLDRIDLALVLGSGWSTAAHGLGEAIGSVPLADLPGFSAPVVAGHGGELRLLRTPSGKVAALFTGRTHFYEGRGVEPVVHGVRTAAAAGARVLVLTNGCGGLNPDIAPGTPVLIRDHINLTAATPLRGATFIDMTEAYSPRLRALARQGVITTSGWKQGMSFLSVRAMECMARHIHVFTHYARYPEGLEAIAFAEEHGWKPPVGREVYGWEQVPKLAADYASGIVENFFPIFAVNPPP